MSGASDTTTENFKKLHPRCNLQPYVLQFPEGCIGAPVFHL